MQRYAICNASLLANNVLKFGLNASYSDHVIRLTVILYLPSLVATLFPRLCFRKHWNCVISGRR